MPVTRAFLKPRSVDTPPQGDFEFLPQVTLYESDTAAGLEAAMDIGATNQSQDLDNYWVVESVEYQVAVLQHAIGMNPAVLSYSALVWSTRAHRV